MTEKENVKGVIMKEAGVAFRKANEKQNMRKGRVPEM